MAITAAQRDELWSKAPSGFLATGVGSLPHHNVDAAMEYAFRLPVPYLPQIPIRHPAEYMIAQALAGLPGLRAEKGGFVSLDIDEWSRGTRALRERTDRAFEAGGPNFTAFQSFEPDADSYSCWEPFIWELGERGLGFAKIQLAGPLTCQWAMRLEDGSTLDTRAEVRTQIFRLVLARAVAMVRRLRDEDVTPLFVLDEPGLYGLDPSNPQHAMGLQELALAVSTLQKEGALVGLHCCSNTRWSSVLKLGLDVLSFDAALSLESISSEREAFGSFLASGGRCAFGVVPTARSTEELHALDGREIFVRFMDLLDRHWPGDEDTLRRTLHRSLYTPACGLALHTPEDAETVLSLLQDFLGVFEAEVRTG